MYKLPGVKVGGLVGCIPNSGSATPGGGGSLELSLKFGLTENFDLGELGNGGFWKEEKLPELEYPDWVVW